MKQMLAAALVIGFAAGLGAQEPVKPGPGVTLPTVVRQVKPEYTPEAQAARIEGPVLLGAVVLTDGSVDAITVERSLDGRYGLDQQAVKAMKEWKFKAGTKDGKPVPVKISVEMTFTLK